MEGEGNVIYGSFGSSNLGDAPLIDSSTSESEPVPAGTVEDPRSVEDLANQLQTLVDTLRQDATLIVSPAFEPSKASEFLDQLKALQQLSNKVSVNLGESESAEDGYISAQADLNQLGADVMQFHQAVLEHARQVDAAVQASSQLVPEAPPQRPAATKPFPWVALGVGILSAGGLVWLAVAANSKKGGRGRSSLSGPGKKIRRASLPAP